MPRLPSPANNIPSGIPPAIAAPPAAPPRPPQAPTAPPPAAPAPPSTESRNQVQTRAAADSEPNSVSFPSGNEGGGASASDAVGTASAARTGYQAGRTGYQAARGMRTAATAARTAGQVGRVAQAATEAGTATGRLSGAVGTTARVGGRVLGAVGAGLSAYDAASHGMQAQRAEAEGRTQDANTHRGRSAANTAALVAGGVATGAVAVAAAPAVVVGAAVVAAGAGLYAVFGSDSQMQAIGDTRVGRAVSDGTAAVGNAVSSAISWFRD